MDLSILDAIRVDKVTGWGIIKAVYERDIKDKDKRVIGTAYMVEISKLNASLSMETSHEVYTRLSAEIAQQNIHLNQTFIQYEGEVLVESDAFAWSNDKGSGAMATSKYSAAKLIDYKRAK